MLNRTIKGAILSAVHDDLMSKESRKKNIIISGLEVVDSTQDADLVGNLLDTEFGFYPEISHTRRLGLVIAERIQPLAVTFVDATVVWYSMINFFANP